MTVHTDVFPCTLLHLAIAANGPFSARDEELKPMMLAFLSHGNCCPVPFMNGVCGVICKLWQVKSALPLWTETGALLPMSLPMWVV